MNLEEIGRLALEAAGAAGADEAEAFVSRARSLVVEVAGQRVETLHQSTETGLGLRVFTGGRMGFAFCTDLSQEGILTAVKGAAAAAQATAPDEFNRLPGPSTFEPLPLGDPKLKEVPTEAKIDLAMAIEKAALAYDKRVVRIEKSTYTDGDYEVLIMNSRGLKASYAGANVSGSLSAVAEQDGNAEMGWSYVFERDFGKLSAEAIGREAAEKAVQLLGGRPVATKRVTLVFDPLVGAEYLELIGPTLSADAVQKGKSLFAGKVGRKVASPLVNLVDDGRLLQGAGAAPVDDEGVPTRRTSLIRGGLLEGYLQNTYTAAKDGTESTGNGIRASFRGTPEVRPSNLFIEAGATSREQLLAEVEEGFYVTAILGGHTANPISGEFSVGAQGLWIKNGKFVQPVRGVAIAGNLLELLGGVEAVGNDLRFIGSAGAPTLRFAPVTVSGE
ncbi:MAG: TldD/PmbA family protein [Chitinophagales bacterium]